jgi:hypothetical protein
MTVILETFLQLVDKLEFYRLPRGVMVMSYFKKMFPILQSLSFRP